MRCPETIQKTKAANISGTGGAYTFLKSLFPLADGVLSGKNKQPVDVPNICCKQRKKNAPNLEVQRFDDPLAPQGEPPTH